MLFLSARRVVRIMCLLVVLRSSKALGCRRRAVCSTHALVELHGAVAPSPGDWNSHTKQHSYLWSSARDTGSQQRAHTLCTRGLWGCMSSAVLVFSMEIPPAGFGVLVHRSSPIPARQGGSEALQSVFLNHPAMAGLRKPHAQQWSHQHETSDDRKPWDGLVQVIAMSLVAD